MRSILRLFDFSALRLFDSPRRRRPGLFDSSTLRLFDSLDARKAGFSLIEVNIAILVIAGGLLSLFALFPAGLKMSTDALSDTRQALFADDFFAYFDDGVLDIDNRTDWQNIATFWTKAREGLCRGFDKETIDNANSPWTPDREVRRDWAFSSDELDTGVFSKGDPNKEGASLYLRFYHGVVREYFSGNASNDKLDAEFLVRIASDYNAEDGLIWKVSLVVSDDGTGGWYYDNPVYHRDFRYAELPWQHRVPGRGGVSSFQFAVFSFTWQRFDK